MIFGKKKGQALVQEEMPESLSEWMDKPGKDTKFGPLTFEGLPTVIRYYNPGLGWTVGSTLSVTPRKVARTIDMIDERHGKGREKKFVDIRRP